MLVESQEVYRAALVRAAELVGGAAPLARRLQVPVEELTRWLAGEGKPGVGTFLRVIDVLIDERHSNRGGQSQE